MAAQDTVAGNAAGVLLSPCPGASDLYDISLVHADGGQMLLLSAQDDSAVVAIWRKTGQGLGLPLLVQQHDGRVIAPYEQCGRVTLGAFRYRRRNATLSRRRPRFLQRRKSTRLPERPVVLVQREIVPRA